MFEVWCSIFGLFMREKLFFQAAHASRVPARTFRVPQEPLI